MIGHALRRVSARAGWDRPIAIGFAIGSVCFLVAPFPGFAQLVGATADAAVFFAGSIFFTVAAALELREVHAAARDGRQIPGGAPRPARGTLFFNMSTFDALSTGCQASGGPPHMGAGRVRLGLLLGVRPARLAGAAGAVRGPAPDRERRMATVNLAGWILFGVSAVASYVVLSRGPS